VNWDLTNYAEFVESQKDPLLYAWALMLPAPPTIRVLRRVDRDIIGDIAIAMF